jgi:rRNA-processing protein FCF1
MTVVAMDTSALMMPVERDVRVFEELDRLVGADADLVAPGAVFAELRRLADGAGKEATAASVGLDLAEARTRTVESNESYADDALVGLARSGEADYVVTNDGPLKEAVLAAGTPVIHIRARNKLAVTQP